MYVFVLDKNHIKSKIMRYLIIYNLCVQCKLYLLHVLFSIMGEKNGLPKNGNIFFCPKHCATIRFYLFMSFVQFNCLINLGWLEETKQVTAYHWRINPSTWTIHEVLQSNFVNLNLMGLFKNLQISEYLKYQG